MSFGDRLGLAGVILSLIALAAPYLWPDKKWIGWIALCSAVALLLAWGWLEFGAELPRLRSQYPIRSAAVVFIVGGCLAVALWTLVQSSPTRLATNHATTNPSPSVPSSGIVEESVAESHEKEKRPDLAAAPAMKRKTTKPDSIPSVTQGSGSAFSINQRGGITAGTVNVGPPPLVLNKEQQDHLTASVQPFASQVLGKINISLHNATPETAEFGAGLDSAFKIATFQTNTGPVTFVGAVLARGVTIRFGTNRTKLAEAVRDSLLRDKVVDRVYSAPGLNADDFLIIVAP